LVRRISSVKSGSVSLMPEGLAADLSIEDMADLLAFIQEKTKF